MKKILFILIFVTLSICSSGVFAAADAQKQAGTPEKETLIVPKIFVLQGVLYIQNVDEGAKVEIYNIVGIKVKTALLNNGMIDVSDLNKGIYIVRVAKTSQKIVIQ